MFFTGVGIKCAPEQRHPAGNIPGWYKVLFLNKGRLVIGILEYVVSLSGCGLYPRRTFLEMNDDVSS